MSVILFIIILGALIFVHELGHFLVAKKNGIRVDEFAVGFPPRIAGFTKGETKYSLNLIPFGGYVKIFGENPDEESLDPDAEDSFVNKPRWVQAAVLVAGVFFNIVFAWFLFFVVLMSGMPAVVTDDNVADIENASVVITSVLEESPAESVGLLPGDTILEINSEAENLNIEKVQELIASSNGEVVLTIDRAGERIETNIQPSQDIVPGKLAIGISMERIGVRQLPIHRAFVEAFSLTVESLAGVFVGLGILFKTLFGAGGDLGYVSGPIGIVSLVGDAAQFGWANLLSFTALLSINLAVLNILPFPALDGGRLLFLGIEAIRRKRIKPAIANTINAVGFMILIGLMIFVTISDVLKLF
jgi:regulator of sigma E protease